MAFFNGWGSRGERVLGERYFYRECRVKRVCELDESSCEERVCVRECVHVENFCVQRTDVKLRTNRFLELSPSFKLLNGQS